MGYVIFAMFVAKNSIHPSKGVAKRGHGGNSATPDLSAKVSTQTNRSVGTKRRQLFLLKKFMRNTRIELVSTAWEAVILPLN